MWQRWQNRQQQQQQQPTISHPTQFTTLDQEQSYDYEDRYLETIAEVDSISSRRQSQHVALPELPFRVVPPMTDLPRVAPITTLPASANGMVNRGLRINVDPQQQSGLDVSPVTPRASSERRRQDEQPISPIDAPANNAQEHLPERGHQSQIPRRIVSGDKKTTKWDDYSGEPTNDNHGKEASVKPGQPVEMQYPQLKQRTQQILAGLKEKDTTKKPAWGRQPPPVAADPLDQPQQREPWRGASGRAAIVEPVKNTQVTRVAIPRHPERNISLQNAQKPVPTHQPHAEPVLHKKVSTDSIKPVVPLKTRNLTPPGSAYGQSPRPSLASPVPMTPVSVIPASTTPQTTAPIPILNERRDVRVESPQYDSEPTTPITPHASPPVQEFVEPTASFVPTDIGREQSRFSWTTYTASTTDSRRSTFHDIHDSAPTPLPVLESPIVVKKRPISSSPFMHAQPYIHSPFADSTGSVVRKPVAGGNPPSRVTSRALSTSKTLPPTPNINEAADKIENLDAQLVTLNRRKQNLNKIVNNLQISLKKNAVVYDMWKRREVEKNIINHESELAEISQEIHEISIQLHRAQRKRDREDGYEKPTGLWIKRVTS